MSLILGSSLNWIRYRDIFLFLFLFFNLRWVQVNWCFIFIFYVHGWFTIMFLYFVFAFLFICIVCRKATLTWTNLISFRRRYLKFWWLWRILFIVINVWVLRIRTGDLLVIDTLLTESLTCWVLPATTSTFSSATIHYLSAFWPIIINLFYLKLVFLRLIRFYFRFYIINNWTIIWNFFAMFS